MGEMKDDDFVTSGGSHLINEEIYSKQWWTQTCLVVDETAQKANIDPEARKKKRCGKIVGGNANYQKGR